MDVYHGFIGNRSVSDVKSSWRMPFATAFIVRVNK